MNIEPSDLSDEIVFSTGKRFFANGGIIGIGPHSNDITEGYDGDLFLEVPDGAGCPDDNCMTPEELRELADYMIARWTQFRDECHEKTYRFF